MKLPKIGRIGTAIAVLVALSAAGTAIATQVGSSDKAPAAAQSAKPRATVQRVATTTVPSATKAPAAKKAPTTTSSTTCLNSFDPDCGRFYWSPQPGPNADMRVTVTASAATVEAGQPVSFTATGDDPDAPIACGWIYYGEGVNVGSAVRIHNRFGRWEPPAKTHGTLTKTYTHTYEKPGTYTVVASFKSGDDCLENYNPYGSEGGSAVTITVT